MVRFVVAGSEYGVRVVFKHMGKRIAVLAHYDAEEEVKPYVVHWGRGLRAVADRVILYSTADSLNAASVQSIQKWTEGPVMRENRGYDFCMWRSALEGLELADIDELILTNSSVVGPVWPLEEVFQRMEMVPCDFWSMTDSFELRWHLQSYFLVFRKRALKSKALRQFFQSVLPYQDKTQVILSYELGLTQFLMEQGLRPASFVSTQELWADWCSYYGRAPASVKLNVNPCIVFPEHLLRWCMPLVKVETLQKNPARVDLARLIKQLHAEQRDEQLLGGIRILV